MRNPLVDAAAEVITALGALRLKPSARVRGDGDGGLVISQPAKPDLSMTYAAARDFVHQMQEEQL